MGIWYIKTGETGGGTSTSDYAGTWADIAAGVAAGDTVYVHGSSVLRELVDVAPAGLRFFAEPGTGRWTQTGRRLIEAGDWAVHASAGPSPGNIYAAAVAAEPVGFVYDYRLGTAEGVPDLYCGHIAESGEATLVDFEADVQANGTVSWFYDAATLSVYVYLPGGDDPRTSGKATEWCAPAGGEPGFKISADGAAVSGGKIDCWLDDGSSNWGLQISGATGVNVSDMEFDSCFQHSAGATGGPCADNVISSIVCRTVQRGTAAHISMHCGAGETMTGCRFSTATLHLAGLRDYEGSPLATSGTLRGMAGYADGTIAAGGLTFRHVTTVRYEDEEALGGAVTAVHAGGGATPSNPADPDTYPILHLHGQYRDFGAANLSTSTSHAAFRRCRFVTDGAVTNGASNNAALNVVSGCECVLESCTVSGEMSGTLNHVLLRVAGSMYLSNCTVRAAGSTNGIFFVGGTGDLDAVHSVFAREAAGALCKSALMPQPLFTKCWYDANIGDAAFATVATYNTQAEWQSVIDPGGTYDADLSAAFVDAETLEPQTGSPLVEAKDSAANPASPRGINSNAYTGTAGAWQGRVNAAGAGAWLSSPGRHRFRRIWFQP